MLSIGHSFSNGFFVYADIPSKRISKYLKLEAAIEFGQKLAEATMQQFCDDVQYFEGKEHKRVVTQIDIKPHAYTNGIDFN